MRIWFVSFFSVCLISFSSFANENKTLVFATVESFPPFEFSQQDIETGIDIDLVEELSRRIDRKIDIVRLPWKRGLLYLKVGKIDGLFSGFKTEEREEFSYFVEPPLHYALYKVFTEKGKEFPYKSIKDLYGKKLLLNRGWAISEEFDEAVALGKIKVRYVDDTKAGLSLLDIRGADGYLGNFHVVEYEKKSIKTKHPSTSLPTPVREPTGAHLMLSKKSENITTELIEEIQLGLHAMKNDGYFEKVEASYR